MKTCSDETTKGHPPNAATLAPSYGAPSATTFTAPVTQGTAIKSVESR